MQRSFKVNKRSNFLGISYGHQIWCKEPLTRQAPECNTSVGLNVLQWPSGVNQRWNCKEIPHSHQNVAKAALEYMLLHVLYKYHLIKIWYKLTMIIWWSEGVFLDRPTRREDDKVCNGYPWSGSLTCQHCEYGRILEKKRNVRETYCWMEQ